MAFRGFNAMQTLAKDKEKSDVESGISSREEDAPAPTTKAAIWGFAKNLWKRVGLVLIILFTILVALSVNALVQSVLYGLSPNKEYGSIVLLIISQFLYAIIVTAGLVLAVILVAREEMKEKIEKQQEKIQKKEEEQTSKV